jgi:hypothetical protein
MQLLLTAMRRQREIHPHSNNIHPVKNRFSLKKHNKARYVCKAKAAQRPLQKITMQSQYHITYNEKRETSDSMQHDKYSR